MSDINTTNLDADAKSPKQARADLLASVGRVNSLTRYIDTSSSAVVAISNALSVAGNLTIGGSLNFSSLAGNVGQILSSQGSGLPAVWVDNTSAKYKATSTTSLAIDATTPKSVTVQAGLSYTAGQGVVVANDATHYMSGTVQSYDSSSGILAFANTTQVGTGTFAAWTVNLVGAPGTNGTNGIGTNGTNGSQIYTGAGVPSSGLGANTDFYINTTNGDYYTKSAGAWTLQGNLTGPAGTGGSTGAVMLYDSTSRYQPWQTTGQGVTIVSSASVKSGVSWARTGTNMVITDNGHGRSVGEWAIVRNTNVSYQDGLITAADTNTFTITCANTGGTAGTAAAYTMGFTIAYQGATGAYTGVVIVAPANWDCVLLGMRMHLAANTRSTTTFNITVPKGNINGVGPQTGNDALSVPNQAVRQDGNTMAAVGATIAVNLSGDYGIYQFAAIPPVTTGIHVLMNF